ncbi:MAG: HaeII family restriction endonuclease [Phycisphaerae bacterium]
MKTTPFNTITKYLNATISLSVDPQSDILKDFQEFAKMVLGVDSDHHEIRRPARLYRVGTTNAADGGLDMWANFGPAVQVKHLSLSPAHFEDICGCIQADQIVIVCKKIEALSIEAVLTQVGFKDRIRGIITELDLKRWYRLACGNKYAQTIGKDLLQAIVDEIALEFPLAQSEKVRQFVKDRDYDFSRLKENWAIK